MDGKLEEKTHREFRAFEKLSCDLIKGANMITDETLNLVKIKLVSREEFIKAMKSATDGFKQGIINNCSTIRGKLDKVDAKSSRDFFQLPDEKTFDEVDALLWSVNNNHDFY
jgi:hypothetical protein